MPVVGLFRARPGYKLKLCAPCAAASRTHLRLLNETGDRREYVCATCRHVWIARTSWLRGEAGDAPGSAGKQELWTPQPPPKYAQTLETKASAAQMLAKASRATLTECTFGGKSLKELRFDFETSLELPADVRQFLGREYFHEGRETLPAVVQAEVVIRLEGPRVKAEDSLTRKPIGWKRVPDAVAQGRADKHQFHLAVTLHPAADKTIEIAIQLDNLSVSAPYEPTNVSLLLKHGGHQFRVWPSMGEAAV